MNTKQKPRDEKPILGIDFGGSNCAAAYYYKGALNIITAGAESQEFNSKTMPTYVGFDASKKYLLGHEAKAKVTDPTHTIFSKIKQSIYEGKQLKYDGAIIKPHLLITEIFNFLKKRAELEIGCFIDQCVLTTPANFGEQTKMILKEAANLAKLNLIRFISEPTAVALYYSRYVSARSQACLIMDLGSMTLDMTICHISKEFIDVEYTAGDPDCGFSMLDYKIREYLKEKIKVKNPEITYHSQDEILLLNMAEKLKIEFCTKQSPIVVKRQLALKEKKVLLCFEFNEVAMNTFIEPYLNKIKAVLNKLFKESLYDERDIYRAIAIGGPVNSGFLKKKLEELTAIPFEVNIDNLFSVCKGAALYGAIICGYHEDEKILSDVTSLSLGVETENNINEIIIPANSRIPCSRRVEFTTSEDFQKAAKINVLEGERLVAEHCKLLGTYILEDLEQNYKGAPVIEVEYSIDYNGTLKVQVTDLKSLSCKSGLLKINQELNAAEKEELLKLAFDYRKEDISYINKIKSVQALRTALSCYKQMVLQGHKSDPDTEQQYIDALKALNDLPLDYDTITTYKLKFQKLCYDYRNQKKDHKSDIKKLI